MTSTSGGDMVDVRSLSHIYKSGDMLLENPAETCIIFVSVIIVSAALEYLLQIVTKVDNKYVRLMVGTMTKELTIIGVLALGLMLSSSLMPAGEQQERFSILFTWANMNIFFMALFFVIVVVAQFLWAAYEQPKWRAFEEGRMDSEEVENMWYKERTYKKAHERYSEELLLTFQLTPTDCALYELLQVFTRRLLVNMSDLSWPVWISLLPIIVLNGARAFFNPLASTDKNYVFYNALLYIAATGYVTMIVFFIFFKLLHKRMDDLFEKRVRRNTVGAHHVPFGNPKRCIALLQGVVMSLNWYVSLYATGMGKDILTNSQSWQAAVTMIIFVVPPIAVHLCLPWCINVLTYMSVMGSVQVHQGLIERVIRRHRGDDDAEDDDDDIDSEEEAAIRKELEKRAALNLENAKKLLVKRSMKRPMPPPGKGGPSAKGGAPAKGAPPKGAPGKGDGGGEGTQPPPAAAKAPPFKGPPPKGPKGPPPSGALAVPTIAPPEPSSPQEQGLQVEARQRPAWMEEDDTWEGDAAESGKGAERAAAALARRMDPIFFEHVDDNDLRDALFRRDRSLKDAFTDNTAAAAKADAQRKSQRGGALGNASPARAARWEQMDHDDAADEDPFDNHERPAWLDSDEEWF